MQFRNTTFSFMLWYSTFTPFLQHKSKKLPVKVKTTYEINSNTWGHYEKSLQNIKTIIFNCIIVHSINFDILWIVWMYCKLYLQNEVQFIGIRRLLAPFTIKMLSRLIIYCLWISLFFKQPTHIETVKSCNKFIARFQTLNLLFPLYGLYCYIISRQ